MDILAQIDAEIARLQAARALLSSIDSKSATIKPTTRKRRKMSAGARKAIADAQRKRWAAVKAKAKAK
jgi:hypothetical protein